MERILYVKGGNVNKVNENLKNGWHVKMIVCAPIAGGEITNSEPAAYVVITKEKKEAKS